MSDVLEIKGFDKLLQALKDSPEKVMPYLKKAMTLSLRVVQEKVAEYPPSTAANRPGRVDKDGKPMGYYERGRGWWYPVMAEKTFGEQRTVSAGAQTAKQAAKRFKVKSIPAVAGYKLAGGGESEMLGRKWDSQVMEFDNGIAGVVGTTVSYADYVQGGRQAKYHEQRGWKTINQALEESMDDINGFFSEAVDEYIKAEFDTE